MRLRLGLGMRFDDAVAIEGQSIAGIGIGIDLSDASDRLFGQAIDRNSTVRASVADVVGNHPSQSAAKGGPNDRPLLFFERMYRFRPFQ